MHDVVAPKRIKQRPQVGVLGKHLTRRSRGACELCASREAPRAFELPPFPEEPDPDRTLIACERCRRWLESGRINQIEAHFLSSAIWSNSDPVRLAAGRMLLACDHIDDPWVQQALDTADIDPSTLEFRSVD
ncbi:MAG: hypothetical protein HN348_08965 [Proteobacteria bacterium]|jgi:hypothetical protein|nr:hypothetical protein [Pseudomonadota bacterium]